MTMGTAGTMTAIAESMGLTLPGASSTPAADANHPIMSTQCGRRIVDMVWEDLTPARIITPAAVDNAVKVAMATGSSTNAIIHLIVTARHAGLPRSLDDLGRIGRTTSVIPDMIAPHDPKELIRNGLLSLPVTPIDPEDRFAPKALSAHPE